ncbi:MAG: phosphoribosylglycinamide formyltransferase [Thermodesulfovibrionales bacterium]|nr:phosphoribosylglycinamide formyltransferase [Thermodesulfovibrionales bacterium]
MLRIGVLASGRGSNFQAVVDSIEQGEIEAEVALLVVDKEDAYAIERAKKHDIPWMYVNPKDFSGRDAFYDHIASELVKKDVGLVLLAGFMRIVGKPLLERFRMKVMNIHPALLPSFPGLHGHRDAVNYGVKVSGCTVHFVDEGMDTGPVIIQAAVPVHHGDTEDSLSERILPFEHRIYPLAVKLFAEGKIEVSGRKVVIKGGQSALFFPQGEYVSDA